MLIGYLGPSISSTSAWLHGQCGPIRSWMSPKTTTMTTTCAQRRRLKCNLRRRMPHQRSRILQEHRRSRRLTENYHYATNKSLKTKRSAKLHVYGLFGTTRHAIEKSLGHKYPKRLLYISPPMECNFLDRDRDARACSLGYVSGSEL